MKKLCLLTLVLTLVACANKSFEFEKFSNVTKLTFDERRLSKSFYDGEEDDLTSGGLGLEGLRGNPPPFKDPLNPTRAELRRSAIYHNYRSLLSLTSESGYGRLYAKHWENNGRVAGHEYVAPLLFESGEVASMMMLQVPVGFNVETPCLVATASSGSRGIYGSIGVVGAWALHKGCAVVHSDKGTGTGFHWLTENIAIGIDGGVIPTGKNPHFETNVTPQFLEKYPHRIATKHAHSEKNIDRYWGDMLLNSVYYAFDWLNRYHSDGKGVRFSPENTLVIGAGISNGGASVIRAAEKDELDVFDGIVVSEPAINLPENYSYSFVENNKIDTFIAKSIPDVGGINALFLPCAARFHDTSGLGIFVMPMWQSRLEQRCENLKNAGLLSAESLQEQAQEAYTILRNNGLLKDSNALSLAFTTGFVWDAYLVNYVNAYGKFNAGDRVCDFSYAFVNANGEPIKTPEEIVSQMYGVSGGIVPVAGVSIVNDTSSGGPRSVMQSKDDDDTWDLAFNNYLCMREKIRSERVRSGIASTYVSGELKGLPSIIVHGRADNLIQVRNSSRPYVVLNKENNPKSSLVYYEIENAQHFDALVSLPAFSTAFIPLHFYFEASLELMFDHLAEGRSLPASRVVKTNVPANRPTLLENVNLPNIEDSMHIMTVDNNTLTFSHN